NGSGDKGIWKYDGRDWGGRNSGIRSLGLPIGAVALAMDSMDPTILYARLSRSDSGQLLGVFRTATAAEPAGSAAAGTLLTGTVSDDASDYSWYDNVIEVDPNDSHIIVMGGLALYVSYDSGATFTPYSSSPDTHFGSIHDDVHALAFDLNGGHSLFAGN